MKQVIIFVILSWATACSAQEKEYAGGSHFECGFARLTRPLPAGEHNSKKDTAGESTTSIFDVAKAPVQEFYIDTTGEVAFNKMLKGGFYDGKEVDEYYRDKDSTLLPDSYYVFVQKGDKYGVLTSDGRWILKPVYDHIDTRSRRVWRVAKDGKQSLFSVAGFLLPFRFDTVYQMTDNYFNVVKDGRWGVYSRKADKLVVPCTYQDMDYCYGCEARGDYLFAKKNGKWGVIDFTNKVLLPFEYDHEHRNMRSDETILCLYKNSEPLRINLNTGKEIPFHQYQKEHANEPDTTWLAGGFMRVEKDDKCGLVNPEGKQILPYAYTFIRYDADKPGGYYLPAPYVAIKKSGHWGVADTTGHIIIPPKYTTGISIEADSFFVCELPGNYDEVLLNKKGAKVLPGAYDKIELKTTSCDCDSTTVAFFKLERDHKYGFYNPKTRVLVEPQYTGLTGSLYSISIPHGVKVEIGDSTGVLDVQTGKIVMPPIFQLVSNKDFPKGLMRVRDNQKFGIYNYQKKKLVVPLKYDYISVLENKSLLRITTGDTYGLMSYSGKILVPEKYTQLRPLNKNFYLLVSQDSTYHRTFSFYDSKKNRMIQPCYDSILAVWSDTLATVRYNATDRLYNPTTGQIIKGTYAKGGFPDRIEYFSHGRAIIHKNRKTGVIDADGNIIIPLKYNGISDFRDGVAVLLQGEDSLGRRLYGFIDTTGKILVPPKYIFKSYMDIDSYFLDSFLVLIQTNANATHQYVGLASRAGTVVIPPVYDKIHPQKNGSDFLVEKDQKFGIVDSLGKVILPAIFDNIALDEKPLYNRNYKFSFPILAKKSGVWKYYKRDGSTLPVKVKSMIAFQDIW